MKRRLLTTVGLLIAGIATGWSLARSNDDTTPAKAESALASPGAESGQESPLATLDWLVGDWGAEGEKSEIEFGCHFTKNDAFLLRSFRILNAKDVSLSGMQIIGWDPAQKTLRSWTYDSNGGFGDELWSQLGDQYTIRTKYTLPDGGVGSNLQVVTYIDNDRFTWKSVNREIDGEFQPDTDEIVLVRRPARDVVKGAK